MQRTISFSFRLTTNERHLIRHLASVLKRSQSDAVRFVIIEASRQLSQIELSSNSDPYPKDMNQEQRGIYVTD
jgi:hypothetical protein